MEQQARGAHHHAGRAVAALNGHVVHKGGDDGCDARVGFDTLGRDDAVSVHLRDHRHAGVDGFIIEQHRAGAALTLAAAALCAGQVQVFAQHVDKQALRRGVHNGFFPV